MSVRRNVMHMSMVLNEVAKTAGRWLLFEAPKVGNSNELDVTHDA